ncbi:MAG: alpha/beta fold hydrolase [Phycisphaerales bacterium]|nr:MAG: alpha/beta fold hydrolase [Phycisphaerales bacterium]
MAIDLPELKDLYPFDSHYLDVTGGRMHYVDEGSGPAVVLLHGNPTWSFYYRELIRGLRDRYRVIAPDHVGCGLSDKPPEYPYTLSTHVDNLEQLIDHLGLCDVTVVVHDWGGPIGFGWAARHPDRVRGFVVSNTAAFLGGRTPFRIRICRWPILGEVAVGGFNAFARAAVRMACRKRERMTPEVVRGYLLPYDTPANRIAILCFVRDIPLSSRVPSFRVLRQIEAALPRFRDQPMLVCWGMRDFCFTAWFLEQWIGRFPQAVVHRFEDAGHYLLEDAHERILPLLCDFLQRR